MSKEITLIFTPFSLEDTIDDKVVDEYKSRIFNSWKRRAKNSCISDDYIDELLPTNTSPISLGQLCLISFLNKHDIKVNYIYGDYLIKKQGLSLNDFKKRIIDVSKNSCIVGFYSMTPTISITLDLIKAVKEGLPDTLTVLGGPHGTYADIETIENNPFVDVVSRGEGEETLLALINEITNNGNQANFGSIDGITYRINGMLKRNPDRILMHEDTIPAPDYSVLPRDFNCLLTVMYARGCPYTCKFCAEGSMWRHQLRFRKPDAVADDIEYITNTWKQHVIHICDSEIDSVPSKTEELLDCIIRRNIPCKLTVNLRCDAHKRLTPKLLEKMKKAGIVAYLIGSESASDYMLKTMGRGASFSDFLKTIEVLRNANAGFIFPGVMIGFPGETIDSIEVTKTEFIKLLDNGMVDYFFPRIFIPYPGSQPFQHPDEYGISLSKQWKDYARYGNNPPFVSKQLSTQELRKQMLSFYHDLAEHSEALEITHL